MGCDEMMLGDNTMINLLGMRIETLATLFPEVRKLLLIGHMVKYLGLALDKKYHHPLIPFQDRFAIDRMTSTHQTFRRMSFVSDAINCKQRK